MKLHYLLLLLLCSISTKSFAAAPDSVFIFTYAIPQDPHKGIHIAYSSDGKSWKAIGQDQSFVSSDFGSWGSQKRMFLSHPMMTIKHKLASMGVDYAKFQQEKKISDKVKAKEEAAKKRAKDRKEKK